MIKSKSDAISIPDPMLEPLRDASYLVGRIAEISGVSVRDVAENLLREHRSLGSAVAAEVRQRKIRRYEWSQGLDDFYRETDAFLYETVVWNRSAQKSRMRDWIARYLAGGSTQPMRVLTFGDGLGFDSLHLAQAGHEVSYFDVSDEGGVFAQKLFDDYGQNVEVLGGPADVTPGGYDVVVCLDVLEHVPDPREVVSLLSDAIRPGGRLIVHAPFWYLAPAVATHLRSNRKYSGDVTTLYEPYGLVPIDGEFFWNPIVFQKEASEPEVRSPGIKRRQRLGGWLLKSARICSVPHRLCWNWMYARQWRPWSELEKIRQQFQ